METTRDLAKQPMGLADSLGDKSRALTVRELAGLLNVSERLIYRMASERRIPSFRICGSIRFDPVVTASWLRQQMPTATPTHMEENRWRH
jgi:excisionase family DNA binding protein